MLSVVLDKLCSFSVIHMSIALTCLCRAVSRSFRFSILFSMVVESPCTALSIDRVVSFRPSTSAFNDLMME